MNQSSPLLSCLRRRAGRPVTALMLLLVPFWAVQSQGATLYWDSDVTAAGNNATTGAGLGGAGIWDTSTLQWWNPAIPGVDVAWNNLSLDTAVFAGTAGTVTLGEAISAGGLTFNTTGYTLTGVTLTLGAALGATQPVISIHQTGSGAHRATIASNLAGTSGFTKTGNGTVVLAGASNSYTGDTVINGGAVVISNASQLGLGTTAISINGLANTGNPGYSGGQLVLNGLGGGITLNREVSVSGRGPGAINNSGGLVSIGYNTLAGRLTLGGPASPASIVATHGITTITGNVQIGNTGNASVFFGNGNYIISGRVSGFELSADRFVKSGQAVGSTLWLQNASNDFAETIRIDSGTVRVSHGGALGVNNSASGIDLNGGMLEVRTDGNGATFSTRNVNQRANSSVFVSRDLAGSAINHTITFGNFNVQTNNTNISYLGRDGYNITVGTGGTVAITTGNPWTLNYNNSGTAALNGAGLLTINNSLSFNDGTGRNMSLAIRGDAVLTGNILSPSGGNHNWTKSDTGTLTVQGTAGTMTGAFNITGTVQVTSIGAFNATGVNPIQLNNGALDYRGTGETRTKLLNLSGTTGNGIILANQPSGSTGLVFNSNPVAAGGLGAKTLFLGGSSEAGIINEIGGVISNSNAATSLSKVGGSTWLYNPAGTTYNTAPTGITSNTAAASGTNTNSLTVSSTTGIVVGQGISGSNIPAGSVVTSIVSGTVITISTNITTAVAASTALTFTANSNFTGNVTVGGGTLQVRPAAGTGNGSDVINNGSQIVFGADTLTNNGWAGGTFDYQGSAAGGTLTEQVGALTPSAGHGIVKVTANGGTPTLNFASLGTRTAGATLNLQPTGGPITFTAAAGTNGILGGYATFGADGTEFAASVTAGGSATPLTGQATLPTSGGVATTNYQSTATPAANLSAQSINSLKMVNAQTITLGGVLTVTSGGVLFDNSNGAASIVNNGTATNTLGAAASEVIITTNGTGAGNLLTNTLGNPLSVNALISSTTGSLTKAGSGILVVGGANTFTGTVTINEGGIRLGATTATLGVPAAGSTLVMRQGTVLDINGAGASAAPYTNATPLNILTVGALNGAGTITSNSATPSAISLGSSATTVATPVFSGIIQDGLGTVSVIKNGTSASAQALTGLNTYTGATIISGGSTLIANSLANGGTASSIGASTSAAGNLVFNNGILRYQGSNAQIYQTTATPSVSIDRLFTLAGAGTIDSSGQFGNSILAAGNQNNAALIFNNSSNAVAFGGAVGARTLTLQGNSLGDNEMGIQLVESGGYTLGLAKSGTGLWLVTNAANSYSLPTTITGGQLQLNANAGNLPNASNLRLAGGVLQTSGTFTRAFGTGTNQVAFTDAAGTAVNQNGGFSASSAKLTVNFGGANAQQTWGTGGIGNGTGTLILSSPTALADVEITNPINLNGAVRTVQVDDNASTGLDFATLSGVLSNSTGTGGLTKTGAATLILGDANTYNGATNLQVGNLVVSSIGALGATSSSLGTNVSGGSLVMGATTNTPILLYVGPGETTTRPISLAGTTGTITIDSSGSGALVLTSVTNNAGANAFTFQLRGTNTDTNMVTSQLTQSGTNALTLTKADGGVWILNPSVANAFTGAINANGGLLGLTSNGIGTAASVTISNGGIFAYGADLTSSTNVILANNSTAVFAGQNNITFNGTLTKASGANDQTFSNNLENGKVLTFNGTFINGEGTANATRNINLRGYGSTTFNGVIQNNTTTVTNILRLDIRQANGAVTTLGADNKGSANSFTGGILLGQGTLRATHTGAFGVAANSLILDGGVVTSTVDLSGANKLVNGVFLQGDPVEFNSATNFELGGVVVLNGSRLLLNNLAGGNTLTLSGTIANSATATFTLAGSGATLINSNYAAGTGTAALQYSGTGSLTLTAANTLAGAVTLNRGATTISGASGSVNAVSGITINPTATLTLDNSVVAGGNNTAGRIAGRAVTLAGGTLSMVSNGTASTETAGALTLNSVDGNITMSGAGTNTLTFASVSLANTGSSLNLSTISSLGANNKVIFTTSTGLGAVNNVLPRVFVGGGDFATYHATNGVMAFAGYGAFTNINSAAATDTLKVDGTYTQTNLTASRTINALAINGNGITVGNATTGIPTLTIGGGAVLVNGGSNTLSVPFISLGANPAIQVTTGAALNITGSIISATSLIKAQGGSLTLSAPQFYTSTTNLIEGALVLNGGTNTIYPNAQALVVDLNSTLDLNGNIQYVGALTTPGTMPNTGGSIMSTPGTGLLVTAGNGTFAGVISGANLNVARVGGNNTWTFESANTYGGTTTIMGGILALENDGTLLNTPTININYAGLSLNNNSSLQTTNNNRINDAATINLRGGTITLNGRVHDAAAEVLGAINALQGANTVTATVGGTGTAGAFTTADLTLASLTRSAGTTVNFNGSSLGSVGNTSHIYITSAPTTQLGGVLGAWAIANSTDYAAYNTGNGVGVVGGGGFTGYDSMFGSGKLTYLFAATAAASTNLTGSNTAALLKIGGVFTNDITFTNPGDSLHLELGGILRSANNNATTIGTTTARGIITSGTNELVIYNASNTTGATVFTINSLIQGATTLIKSGGGVLSLTGQNTYSLGTIVNQGILELRGTNPGDVVIPAGGLTINGGVQGTGAAVTMFTNPGQIAAANDVTLNGRATLTFVGNNTLSSLTLNNNGGDAAPTVTPTGVLTLTSNTPVTATSSNAVATANITGGTLVLASGANTFDIAPIAIGSQTYTTIQPTLNITSIINGPASSISKTGDGILQLSAQNTFNGLTIGGSRGGVLISGNSTPVQGGAGIV
ncbi:MAG: autotransporter-associated beta strand repeat-containing protein, partial [Prosthecobacter sp.]